MNTANSDKQFSQREQLAQEIETGGRSVLIQYDSMSNTRFLEPLEVQIVLDALRSEIAQTQSGHGNAQDGHGDKIAQTNAAAQADVQHRDIGSGVAAQAPASAAPSDDKSEQPKVAFSIKTDGEHWFIHGEDVVPGLNLLGKDLAVLLEDLIPAWKRLHEVAPQQVPQPPSVRSAIERMVRHHKLCPAFRGESPCKCDANYAYAKLNEPPRSSIEPICPKCKGSGESPMPFEHEELGLGLYACSQCGGTGKIRRSDSGSDNG